jgi:catechol 2,3-dioxygenase-like lactoylglutathione lyase family enzyme
MLEVVPVFGEASIRTSLPVADIDRAKKWYADTLDLEPVKEDAAGVWYELGGGTEFFLYPSKSAGTNQATAASISFGSRFDQGVDFLRDRGVDFLDFEYEGMSVEDGVLTAPDGMRAAWFTDSEGNILAISSR